MSIAVYIRGDNMDFPGFRKNFSTTELASFMRNEFNLDDITVGRLIDEEIDGLALLELTESDLRELGIRKMGTLKKIRLLIRQNSTYGQSDHKPATPSICQPITNRVSHDAQISSAVLEVMKRIGNIQNQPSTSFRDYSSAPPISPVAQISSTTPFVPSPVDLKPVIDLTSNASPLNISSAQHLPPSSDAAQVSEATSELYANQSNTPTVTHTNQVKTSKPPILIRRPYTHQDLVPEILKSSTNDSGSRPQRKAKHPLRYVQDSEATWVTPSMVSMVQTEPGSSKDVPRIVNVTSLERRKTKSMRWAGSGYKLPDGVTFDDIDLHEEIEKMPGCQALVKELVNDGQKNGQVHRKFVQAAVAIFDMMSERIGYKKYYPASHLKTQMAKAIIRNFPNLAETDSYRLPHAAYYDANERTGYIENRFKTLRRGLDSEDRAYRRKAGVRRKRDLDVGELIDFYSDD